MAATEPFERAPAAARRPVMTPALGGVRGTIGMEAAARAERGEDRRQQPPIQTDRSQQQRRDHRAQSLPHSFSISRTTWSYSTSTAFFLAMNTTSSPAGNN